MKVKSFSVESVRFIALEMAKEFPNTPTQEFDTRYKGVLESCINQPFQSIGGKDLYPTIIDKASILFYLLIKDHPFVDGNKRMAVMILNSFLIINGFHVNTTKTKLYNLAIKTAKSKTREKDEILEEIKKFLEKILDD